MSGPRDIISRGREDTTTNYLGLSSSPISTFHSPIGSYRANNDRLPSTQLKRISSEHIKVLLLENINETAVKILEGQTYQVECLKDALDKESLMAKIK